MSLTQLLSFKKNILIYSVPTRICYLRCIAEVSHLPVPCFLPAVRQIQLSEEIPCLMPNTKGHRRKGSGEKRLLFCKMMLWIGFCFVPKDVSFGLHFPSAFFAA